MRIFRKTIPSEITKKAVELVAPYARGLKSRAYIFCDSKSTLSYEAEIAEKFGGSFSIEVTSFSRYVLKRSNKVGHLSKSASALVIADILAKNKNELTRLKRSNYSVSINVYELIEQLKASKITPEDLSDIVDSESSALAFKLNDIRIVYSEYEKYLKSRGLYDDGMILSLMPDLLKNDEKILGAKVVVAGISNFTAQSLDIVVALERLCDLDCVILSYDGDSAVNESYYKLLSLFKNAKVFDDDSEYPRAVERIKNRLFAPESLFKIGSYDDSVSIVEAEDALEEADFVAKTIALAVKNEGKRYKDFAVACPDVENLAPVYKKAFDDYGIALYADVKMSLSSHPMTALFTALCELKRYNARVDKALAFSECTLAFSEEEASAFSDHVLKNALKRYALNHNFSEGSAEAVREKIVACCSKLLDNGTIDRHIAAFRSVFDYLEVKKRGEELTERLAKENEDLLADFSKKGYEVFNDILSQTQALMADRSVTVSEFCDLILSAAAAAEISLLPRYDDCVFLGDYRSARIRASKILFCTGLTADTPFYRSDDALLCDRELIRMEGYKLVVEPKISIVNKRERECVATTLMSFRERLYATYPLLSIGGEKTKRGQVAEYLLNMFSSEDRSPFVSLGAKRAQKTAQNENDYISKGAGVKNYFKALERFKNGGAVDLTAAASFIDAVKNVDPSLYALALSEADDRIEKKELSYGGGLSASLIESYFTCPYSAFGKKILGLKEADTGEIEAWEFGNIIHRVLEEFAKICDSVSENEVDLAAKKTVDEVLTREEFARYTGKPHYKYALEATKNEAIKECGRIYRMQKKSAFKVFGTEVRFGDEDEATLPSVKIPTSFGDRKISGFIDRLDVFTRPDGKKYARVVDYKTGSAVDKKAELSGLYSGKNVQLYLYMNAVSGGGFTPAGLHYFAANDDYIDAKDKRRTYYGAMVGSDEILSAMDGDLIGGNKSDDYGSCGKINDKDVFDEERFLKLIEYSKKVTISGAEEMARGCFPPSPTEGACERCGLKGACRFDGDDRSRFRENVVADGEKIVKAVEDGDEKNG